MPGKDETSEKKQYRLPAQRPGSRLRERCAASCRWWPLTDQAFCFVYTIIIVAIIITITGIVLKLFKCLAGTEFGTSCRQHHVTCKTMHGYPPPGRKSFSARYYHMRLSKYSIEARTIKQGSESIFSVHLQDMSLNTCVMLRVIVIAAPALQSCFRT